jgi:hypothetical protein
MLRAAVAPFVRKYAPRSTAASPRNPRIVPSRAQAISNSHSASRA